IIFVLYARFKPGAAPTRRPIGTYGAISLEEARRTAGEWRSQVEKGIDPAAVERAAREAHARAEALRIRHSFANVFEDFARDKLVHERRGRFAEQIIRSVFVPAWAPGQSARSPPPTCWRSSTTRSARRRVWRERYSTCASGYSVGRSTRSNTGCSTHRVPGSERDGSSAPNEHARGA